MKRSEINTAIRNALAALEDLRFALPPFAKYSSADWHEVFKDSENSKRSMLGWDVTDFGGGDFASTGAVLFTLRNGAPDLSFGTPYAEKIMFFLPGQRIPFHFHNVKTEDIINRGGGVLEVTLYNSLPSLALDMSAPTVFYCDGEKKTAPAGAMVSILPGASITLRPKMYHRLGASKSGVLVAGEVSSVNDDLTDNIFLDPLPRFAKIEEDEAPLFPLCNEH